MPLNISSNAKGILFIIAAVSCLSVMDGVTRYLTDYYSVIAINMFRYFFLFLFVISINSTGNKSVILVSQSKFKLIQILRGTILAVEMCFAHYLFLKIGLIETHAIFASCPLMVAALSVFILKEKVGSQEQDAVAIGASYTVGSLAVGVSVHQVDNVNNTASDDRSGYQMTLKFAF